MKQPLGEGMATIVPFDSACEQATFIHAFLLAVLIARNTLVGCD
jgi:hypothetical protein